MAIAAVGTAVLLGLGLERGTGIVIVTVASIVISLGLAPVITLATELIVGSAPPEQAGAATGMSETSGELGGALGIAILGSVGTAVYRTEVADLLPSGIPAEVADAARDTLGGALAIAQTLPDALASAVVAAAQTSFVDAIHFVAAVAAVLAVVTAIGGALALRTVPARSEPAEEEPTAEPVGATDCPRRRGMVPGRSRNRHREVRLPPNEGLMARARLAATLRGMRRTVTSRRAISLTTALVGAAMLAPPAVATHGGTHVTLQPDTRDARRSCPRPTAIPTCASSVARWSPVGRPCSRSPIR
jgi:hypothetical protein